MSQENKKKDIPQTEEAKVEEIKAEEAKTEEAKNKPEKETEAKSQPEKEAEDKKTSKKDKKSDKGEKAEKSKEKPAEAETKKVEETAEYAALNDKYLRLCAEYDNFRRRSQKEKESLYGDIRSDTLKKFLPVYDNLVRALEQPTEDEAYRKGVEMIMTQFTDTLDKLGVKKIESLGKTFDPAVHNAVMHEDNEEKGENEIVQVFQEGFMIGDKVVRFAMVKVAN